MFREKALVFEKKDRPFDLEKWLSKELPAQYETKAKILNRNGLLEILPEAGEKGIVSIDGEECPFPDLEAIIEAIESNELYRNKLEQGFTELEITPFGLPLETIAKTVEKAIVRHYKEGKLFSARKNPGGSTEQPTPLELDENQPVYQWEGYKTADLDGRLVYYPKEFSNNHGGRTKAELLKQAEGRAFKGYNVFLREPNPNIPREGRGETKGGRKQLETNKQIKEYLRLIKTGEEYRGEDGLTPEDRLTMLLTHLEKTDEAIDDYSGNGSISFQVGTYFPSDGVVPYSYWFRGGRQLYLYGNDPDNRHSGCGAASGVRIEA